MPEQARNRFEILLDGTGPLRPADFTLMEMPAAPVVNIGAARLVMQDRRRGTYASGSWVRTGGAKNHYTGGVIYRGATYDATCTFELLGGGGFLCLSIDISCVSDSQKSVTVAARRHIVAVVRDTIHLALEAVPDLPEQAERWQERAQTVAGLQHIAGLQKRMNAHARDLMKAVGELPPSLRGNVDIDFDLDANSDEQERLADLAASIPTVEVGEGCRIKFTSAREASLAAGDWASSGGPKNRFVGGLQYRGGRYDCSCEYELSADGTWTTRDWSVRRRDREDLEVSATAAAALRQEALRLLGQVLEQDSTIRERGEAWARTRRITHIHLRIEREKKAMANLSREIVDALAELPEAVRDRVDLGYGEPSEEVAVENNRPARQGPAA